MKAQLIGQVFIYIITITIVSFLLFYGYSSIVTFKKKADQVSFIQFKNDLQNTIEVLSIDFGSVKVKDFIVPENINTVCFVKSYPGPPSGISALNYPIMEDSVNSLVNKNIFLIKKNVEQSFFTGKIRIEDEFSNFVDFKCVEVADNKINLRMECFGSHTVIS